MAMINKFQRIFGTSKMAVIGMIHLKPLPGTPRNFNSVQEIVDSALKEAAIYEASSIDGVLIENMADLPYLQSKDFGPEIVATMARVATEVRKKVSPSIPCGIQILAGGNKEALAISKACGLQFIRCEGFIFSHIADEGWMDSCAGDLLRYRKYLNCEDVAIYVDIKKKHSAHAVTSDISVKETAKAAEFFLADGVILTGAATGEQTDPKDLLDVSSIIEIPVLIGSGITIDNVSKFTSANGLIIGSHFKQTSKWNGKLDQEKIESFMKQVKQIRDTL